MFCVFCFVYLICIHCVSFVYFSGNAYRLWPIGYRLSGVVRILIVNVNLVKVNIRLCHQNGCQLLSLTDMYVNAAKAKAPTHTNTHALKLTLTLAPAHTRKHLKLGSHLLGYALSVIWSYKFVNPPVGFLFFFELLLFDWGSDFVIFCCSCCKFVNCKYSKRTLSALSLNAYVIPFLSRFLLISLVLSPWETHLRSSYSSLPFFESPDDWKAATIEDRW